MKKLVSARLVFQTHLKEITSDFSPNSVLLTTNRCAKRLVVLLLRKPSIALTRLSRERYTRNSFLFFFRPRMQLWSSCSVFSTTRVRGVFFFLLVRRSISTQTTVLLSLRCCSCCGRESSCVFSNMMFCRTCFPVFFFFIISVWFVSRSWHMSNAFSSPFSLFNSPFPVLGCCFFFLFFFSLFFFFFFFCSRNSMPWKTTTMSAFTEKVNRTIPRA